jgi:hypothetical protein
MAIVQIKRVQRYHHDRESKRGIKTTQKRREGARCRITIEKNPALGGMI